MITKTQVVFEDAGDFQATAQAEAWLKFNGFSFGPLQRDDPRAVIYGDVEVHKWRTLTMEQILRLDGRIDGDARCGPVIVTINDVECTARVAR